MSETPLTQRTKGVPRRTCTGCRAEREQSELIRLVAAPSGAVVPDFKHRLPGRGAYVCYDMGCVRAAAKGRLARALALPSGVRPDELARDVRDGQWRRTCEVAGVARKAGAVAIGAAGLGRSLAAGKVHAILLGADASPRTAGEVRAAAARAGVPLLVWISKRALGEVFGRAEVAVAAVGDRGFAASIARAHDRWRALNAEEES